MTVIGRWYSEYQPRKGCDVILEAGVALGTLGGQGEGRGGGWLRKQGSSLGRVYVSHTQWSGHLSLS